MTPPGKKSRVAVMGGSEDGKSFLVSGLIRGHWNREKRRAVVFDPWIGEIDWGPGAWVTDNFVRWKAAVENSNGCAVVWDEGTSFGGRDRDNIGLFTAIRHRHPYLYFMGHSYATMLPVMRGSLTGVLLAVRDPDDAAEWGRVMVDRAIVAPAQRLKQYEFLYKRKHQPHRILSYTPAQIERGISL
ncbi:hypothetical protein OpiT1DRAFT_01228 [Opitutaceae bacterium TAV1]|nr:hypothetical protein OpiT1DRAFT_01228 [Opitutaceae bacterium TAV1]